MAETIQLTDDLAVAWEGDVVGYAPAIALWNRALVELEREMKAYAWPQRPLTSKIEMLEEVFLTLLFRAFFAAGANVETLPLTRPAMFPFIRVEFDKLRLLIDQSVITMSMGHDERLFHLHSMSSGVMRPTFDGIRCAVGVEENLVAPPTTPMDEWITENNTSADTTMLAWLRYDGKAKLRIALRMGLRASAARLTSLKLLNTGPTDELDLDVLAPRLNVITGDNGLGKSFLLEAAWFMLTGHWHNLPAVVTKVENDACITARLSQGSQTEVRVSPWIRREQGWASPREHAAEMDPGLIVYARVDGSFSVWDSHRNVHSTTIRNGSVLPPPRVYPFSYRDVMYGLKVWLDDKNEREVSLGLINEWREWQTGNKPQFALLKSILAALGPDGESLTPGTPSRPYLDDAKDIPTIQMGYDQEVPITLAPAGAKRVAMLAYVLTWAISEHRRMVEARAGLPARSVVLLIDEPETHLHPRWQRTILPSLLKALEVGFGEPKVEVQMFVATHSPLVLASLEPHFDPALDALWKLDLKDRKVKLTRDVWHKRGDANAWLTSDVFDMDSTRSVEAEKALKRAKGLALRGTATPDEIAEVQEELARSLTDTDRAWRAWESFVEHLGTQR